LSVPTEGAIVDWDDMGGVLDYQASRNTLRPCGAVVARTVTEEAESYNSSVAGVDIEATRAGVGVGPTKVLAAIGGRFTFTESKVGFPMLSQTTIPDDKILMVYVRSATPGSRMCEIDLEPGAVLAYAPAAEHTARNLPGLEFMFAITDRQRLVEHAEQLGIRIEAPRRGEVHLLARTPKTDLVGPTFSTFADAAATGEYPSTVCGDDVLRAMTHALSEEVRGLRVGCTNMIDSRHVVHDCIEYAHAVQRIPSISELCLVAHVSERRLRKAFTDEYDMPPTKYFRLWALDEAHRRLLHNDAHAETVTEVALGFGFNHLGRFSVQYKAIYGEKPSTTLSTDSRRLSLV
jgi:AraC-like DNA-binding protein